MPQLQHVNPWVVAAQSVDAERQRRAAEERQAELDAEKVRQFNASNALDARQIDVSEGVLKQRISEANAEANKPTPLGQLYQTDVNGQPVYMSGSQAVGMKAYQKPDAPAGPKSLGTLYQVRGPKGEPIFKTAEEAQGQQAYKPPENITPSFIPDVDQVDTFARQIIEHRMAPSQLNSMLGGFGKDGQTIKRAVLARAIEIAPNFNFQEAESNFAFGKNTGTQTTVKMIDNIQKSMPVLERLVGEMDLGGVRIINRATIAAKSQFGQEGAASFELARNIIADEFAKILQSGGSGSGTSDAKMRQALDIMGGDMSPQQWKGVLGTAKELLGARRETLTKGTYLENTGQQSQSTPAGGPRVGERRDFGGRVGVWDGKAWRAE